MNLPPDRLIARVAELEAKLRDAEATASAKDDFIAAISRELSNPLAPVLLAVERLRAVVPANDAERTETALHLLERAILAFDRRTRALLSLADLSAGVALPAPAPVDISALVQEAAAQHAEAARRAGCTLRLEIEPGVVAAALPEGLTQVLEYLLANAFRFGAGRQVRMAVHVMEGAPPGGGLRRISVIDEGPGLRPEDAARVFSLFGRARGPLEPGLGVGLWVASRLVLAMGGRISVDSAPGEGAQFHVTLARDPGGIEGRIAPTAENLQVRDEPAEDSPGNRFWGQA